MRTWPREPMAHKQNTQQMVKNTINIHLKPCFMILPEFMRTAISKKRFLGEWGWVWNDSFEKMEEKIPKSVKNRQISGNFDS